MTAYGTPPVAVAAFELDEWTEFLHYLYLPVVLPESVQGIVLPRRLRFLHDVVTAAMLDAAIRLGRDLNDDHIYVTARRGHATPDNPLNRPGWHCDGFGTDDVNYVWWDRWPTRFAVGEFTDISSDHHESMRQFDAQAPALEPVTPLPQDRTLYRLDPFCVHTTPAIPPEGGMRSFVKVSISRHRYNLVGNSHNHGLDYRWQMFPRDVARNDPAQYGRDYYVPCPRGGADGVGRTCVCGGHTRVCKACGATYLTWENDHYVPSLGHFDSPTDAIEPYYTCTGESARAVARRTQ